MDTITRNVKDIGSADRQALEHVIGQGLLENQQVIISVVNLVAQSTTESTADETSVPDWWKIYEGLSDAEIEQLDQAVRQRANLTRNYE